MSETIQSISNGTYTIGSTSATNFIAGPGIVIDQPSAGTVRIGNDETVLWENANGVSEDNGFTVSEQFTNFKRIRYIGWTNSCYFSVEVPVHNEITSSFRFGVTCMCADIDGAPLQIYGKSFSSNNGLTYTASRSEARWFNYNNTTDVGGVQPFWGKVYKIVGINRISGGNA